MTDTASSSAAPSPRPAEAAPARLMSLDALRGFDMFWILGADAVVGELRKLTDAAPVRFLAGQLDHCAWAGFAFYDLIFPLFVFMAGVSLVFSLGKIVAREGRAAACRRLFRRALLLYLLGIFYYGGFSTSFQEIRLLGVLQRIALCYLGAGLVFVFLQTRGRIAVAALLLAGYFALMTFVPVPGVGAGSFEEGRNLANYVDAKYLPCRKWDGDHDPEGLLSTMPAIASCLLGVLAGTLLLNRTLEERRKILYLAAGGVALAALGWAWSPEFPVVKKLWTSSFVLVAGGYSCLLLALFYLVIDVWRVRAWALPFVWIGMNPITLYLAQNVLDLEQLVKRFVGGDVGRWLGPAAPLLAACLALALTLWLGRFLYRRKIFLRL
jgi:predicted acyltransferase